jgi:hypothetical protein
MNELAFNGMVFCIYHGRGNNYIKAFLKWFLHLEYDSAPVRMLCAVFKAQATGIFVDLTPVLFLIPMCSWSPCAMLQNLNVPEALNHSSAHCKSVSELSKWKS